MNAADIASAITHQLFKRAVTFCPETYWTGFESDLLFVTKDLRLIDVEIKISRADLKRDAGKEKWWHRGIPQRVDGKLVTPAAWSRTHPHKVWKQYYAVPATLWKPWMEKDLPSADSGILLAHDRRAGTAIECLRRAKPDTGAPKITAEQALDIARLLSLRYLEQGRRAAEDAAIVTRLCREASRQQAYDYGARGSWMVSWPQGTINDAMADLFSYHRDSERALREASATGVV